MEVLNAGVDDRNVEDPKSGVEVCPKIEEVVPMLKVGAEVDCPKIGVEADVPKGDDVLVAPEVDVVPKAIVAGTAAPTNVALGANKPDVEDGAKGFGVEI
jgi:hypothetical protein